MVCLSTGVDEGGGLIVVEGVSEAVVGFEEFANELAENKNNIQKRKKDCGGESLSFNK
jgi:hypothetical protein